MNGTEQRNHRRVTDDLAKSQADFADAVFERFKATDKTIWAVETGVLERVNAERTHRLELAEQQRAYVDRETTAVLRAFYDFRSRGFWGRLNWLLMGR